MHVQWESDGRITADGRAIAVVDRSFWGNSATVDVVGEQWNFSHSWGTYEAESGGQVRWTASKQGFFNPSYLIEGASEATLEIRSAGMFSSGFEILAQGQVVSEVGNASFWGNRPEADLPDEVPLAEAVFVLWLCYMLRQQQSSNT